MATSPQATLSILPGKTRPSGELRRVAHLVVNCRDAGVSLAGSDLAEVLQLPESTPLEGSDAVELFTLAAAAGQERQLAALQRQFHNSAADRSAPGLHLLTAAREHSLQIHVYPFSDHHLLLSVEDVTEISKARKDIYTLAYQDQLTGIANRSSFENSLDDALRQVSGGVHKQLAVLFLDLDRFKSVNDTLGHHIGDSLLRLVSERLRSVLRENDVVGRLGGDEFAILLTHSDEPCVAAELATRIIDLLQRPYLIEGHVINVGASVGIALAPADGATRNHVLRSADLALYHSKRTGRGTFSFFQPAMEERAQERRTLELDLRKALLLRQFELHYQPQINVGNQHVIGMEALLRWRHPKRGLLLPAEFLPCAEEIGLAVSVGEWVLKTACKEAAQWPADLTVAINISPLHFESSTFAVAVEHALRAANLPGPRVEIEVTEDVMLRNGTEVLRSLDALRKLGVRIAIDSFGTGVASLGQLVNFTFDKIKIDRSLISGEKRDAKGRAIVRAISAFGQSLGITTLAAGVETREHLAVVQSEGCSHVQGFYYSRAVPAGEIADLLSRQIQ